MTPPNIVAAPNRSHIVAKVLRVQRSPVWRDRWQLELELSASRPLEGPHIPLVGRTLEANLVTPLDPPPVGATIEATAEYVGGADRGVLNLTDVETRRAD
jgi:hypothetical protein